MEIMEYRLGYMNLNYYCYIQSDNVKTCTHWPYTTHLWFEKNKVLSEDDIKNKLKELEEWRSKTLEALRYGEKTSCHACAALRYGIYSKTPKVLILGVGPNFAGGTKCNLKTCISIRKKDVGFF